MIAGIFDEIAIGQHPAADDAGEENVGEIGLQGIRVMRRDAVAYCRAAQTKALQQTKVGLVPGHCQDEIVFDPKCAFLAFQRYFTGKNPRDPGMEMRRDTAFLDPVDDIGAYPILDVFVDIPSPDGHGNPGTFTV